MKRLIRKYGLIRKYVRPIKHTILDYKIGDSEDTLLYIHIGKCGGASLWKAINESQIIKRNFASVKKIHTRKPPIKRNVKYLIVIRNPIQRAISAFNWRYKLVVEDEAQRYKFKGEWEILSKYRCLNAMAELLYVNGKLNSIVAEEFKLIHHLKEDISYYLSDIIDHITAEQLFAVLAKETLNTDIKKQLAVDNVEKTHENANSIEDERKELSNTAYDNLRKFLKDDYICINWLLDLKNETSAEKKELLK